MSNNQNPVKQDWQLAAFLVVVILVIVWIMDQINKLPC